MGNILWFTNLLVDRSQDPITPYLTYEQGRKKGLYPKYDNYDAIEVSKVAEIPSDYKGVMGVPITFLYKWVPESGIEIVKFRKGDDDKDLAFTREREYNRTSEYSSGEFRIVGLDRYIEGNTMPNRRMHINGKEIYARILIERV
jgi:hypothetical protein